MTTPCDIWIAFLFGGWPLWTYAHEVYLHADTCHIPFVRFRSRFLFISLCVRYGKCSPLRRLGWGGHVSPLALAWVLAIHRQLVYTRPFEEILSKNNMLWVWFIFPSYSVPPNRTNLQDAGRIIRPHGSDKIRLRHVAAMTCFIPFSPFAENHKTILLRLLDSLIFTLQHGLF